jgi:hypothetical protein
MEVLGCATRRQECWNHGERPQTLSTSRSLWGGKLRKSNDTEDVAGKAPGFYLYPADLERELAPLPATAQAIWVRMLCRMHWAPRRGFLEHTTGEGWSDEDIARLVGLPVSMVSKMVYAMEHRYGTFSRDDKGVIFNRRMVRDTDISNKRREAGKMGGNPNLVGKEVNQTSKQTENLLNQTSNHFPTPSSSSSSSSSSSVSAEAKPTHARRTARVDGFSVGFDIWFERQFWTEYWRNTAKAAGKKALAKHAISDEARASILAAMLSQKPGYMRRDTEKRPYLSTWANQERFNDEPEVFENGAAPKTTGQAREDRVMELFEERIQPYVEQRIAAQNNPIRPEKGGGNTQVAEILPRGR